MKEEQKKILIIDDDKFLLDMYAAKFVSSGFEVTACISGAEVLSKLEGGYEPDVFVVDIIMPIMDGWSLIEEIKNKKYAPNAKIVILSNQGEQADLDKGEKFKVSGYIIKALKTPTEVVNEIKKIAK